MAPDRIGAEELFRRHAVDVGRLFRMLGMRGPVIDDLVQQVFLVAHRKGGYEVGPAKPMTWLRAIGVRVASDFRKSERRRRLEPDDDVIHEMASPDATPEAAAARTQDLRTLERALAGLSFDHRAVFVLFELERESFESIARILDIPVGTVGSRLSTARAKVLERYRPKIAKSTTAQGAADPAHLRLDPAAPEILREDLEAAVKAQATANMRPEHVGWLLRFLGAGEDEVGALVDKVIEVARRLHDYDASPPATQLREIAVHIALDQERRRGRSASGVDPPRLVVRLRSLGFKQRAALVLFEIEGERCEAIGKMLDNTPPDGAVALVEAAQKALVEAYRASAARGAMLPSKPRGGVS